MAETIKCALFVDYDSFQRSPQDDNGQTAERLAQTSAAWIAAIEGGKLISPPAENGTRRRVLIRRCYADPELLGLNRSALIASGFEVVDCPHQAGRKHNAADLHMVIDTIDALDHPTGYNEFILLSADADLTPVLLRLRAHNRSTVIFGDEETAGGYRALADGMIEAERFGMVLAGEELDEERPEPEPVQARPGTPEAAAAAAAPPQAERTDIEALARKVHASTNVPVFSPRTFADLFRILAQEIAEKGYHFQDTAEHVTEKLVAAGRNVNRRQVLFVVKGLALKGHVFSTTDTPERLAEVFREQVNYLIGTSGLSLEDREKELMAAWIVGRVATPAKKPPAATPPPPAATPPAKTAVAEDAAAKKTPPVRRRVAPRPAPAPKETTVAPARAAAPVKEKEAPEPAPEKAASPVASAKPAPTDVGGPTPAARPLGDLRQTVASRFAAITKGTFGNKPAATAAPTNGTSAPRIKPPPRPTPPAPANTPPPRPAAPAAPAAKPAPGATRPAAGARPPPAAARTATAEEPNKDALESSILAAIAQAVDVLVDDGGEAKAEEADFEMASEPAVEEAAEPPPEAEPPEPEASEGGDSEDIGDEIQRIIASYSRARKSE